MFKNNPDGMRMEPTPERVLSICRMVARSPISQTDLLNSLTLGNPSTKETDQVNKSIAVAIDELGAIVSKDGKLVLNVDSSVISSAESFRRYVASQVFSRKDSTFVMFTKWIIAQNDGLFQLGKWEVMAKTCAAESKALSGLDENAVLGWRFWAAFLGLGYLNGTMFLPNMKVRLQDVLASSYASTFRFGEATIAGEFLSWLKSRLPEVQFDDTLPLALSAGLRTLDELGLIKLERWTDSVPVHLFFVDGALINEFTHITVFGEDCK